jgi:plastocyanin domain-containing protein
MKNKKNNFTLIGIAVIILIAAIFMITGSGNTQLTGNSIIGNNKNNVQIVKLSVQGSQYVLTPSQVKAGVPVRIEGDIANMPGCSKSVVISYFNIRKTLTTQDNTIEFTPDKAGTFNIACSMNMYRGTFTVLESDGSKSNYVQQSNTPSNSGSTGCGMTQTTGKTGGCGCMG